MVLVIAEQRDGVLNNAELGSPGGGPADRSAGAGRGRRRGSRRGRRRAGRGRRRFGPRRRPPRARVLHARRLRGRVRGGGRGRRARSRVPRPHLSDPRVRPPARGSARPLVHRRLRGGQAAGRPAGVRAADVPGEVRGRRRRHRPRAPLRQLPDRRVPARCAEAGGRHRRRSPVSRRPWSPAPYDSRWKPPFQEAKQAVDLTQAEAHRGGRARHQGPGAPEPRRVPRHRPRGRPMVAASRPICDSGWLPMDRQIGSSGQTVAPQALPRPGHLRRHPAPRGHEGLPHHRGREQGRRGAHLRGRRLRHRRRPVRRGPPR